MIFKLKKFSNQKKILSNQNNSKELNNDSKIEQIVKIEQPSIVEPIVKKLLSILIFAFMFLVLGPYLPFDYNTSKILFEFITFKSSIMFLEENILRCINNSFKI